MAGLGSLGLSPLMKWLTFTVVVVMSGAQVAIYLATMLTRLWGLFTLMMTDTKNKCLFQEPLDQS